MLNCFMPGKIELLRCGLGGGSGGSSSSSSGGGYTSIKDRFDGGGPGASGGAFQGGGVISSAANRVTGRTDTGT